MGKVKWGVLGCAGFARRRTIPAMLGSTTVELIGVASRSPEKAESFRAQFGLPKAYASYEDMLDDPQIQAIYLPVPSALHAEWTIRAAEKGKHVLCEKPFAANGEEAHRVLEVATQHGVHVAEAFMWRFHAQHELALGRIRDDGVGPVRLVRASFTLPKVDKPNFRFVRDLGGGSTFDVGCYPICAARYYFQREPTTAFARVDIDPECGVDMRMSGVLEFAEGRALLDCGFNLPYRTGVEIVGECGTILIPQSWRPASEAVIIVNGESVRAPSRDQYIAQFDDFSESLLSGRTPRYDGTDAVRQARALGAILRSASTGSIEPV